MNAGLSNVDVIELYEMIHMARFLAKLNLASNEDVGVYQLFLLDLKDQMIIVRHNKLKINGGV